MMVVKVIVLAMSSKIEDWVGWCLSACSAGENNVVSQSWVLGQNIDYPPLDITCDFENAI